MKCSVIQVTVLLLLCYTAAVSRANLTRNGCGVNYLKCESGENYPDLTSKCFPEKYQCDGDYDCTDGSDEKYCEKFNYGLEGFAFRFVRGPCLENGFLCRSGSRNKYWYLQPISRCIPKDWICDKTVHCYDKSDELFCPYPKSGLFSYIYQRDNRTYDSYMCPPNNGISSDKSISKSKICDGKNDCVGGFDEVYCPYFFKTTTTTTTTPEIADASESTTDLFSWSSSSTAITDEPPQQISPTSSSSDDVLSKFAIVYVTLLANTALICSIAMYLYRRHSNPNIKHNNPNLSIQLDQLSPQH